MNRHYTAENYLKLINKIRQARPEIAITTDIIVGYPGESNQDFQATAKLMRHIKFDMAYIAQYSPRPNTAAAKLDDNVPKAEKKRREKILTEILKQTALHHNQQLIGQSMDVLVEKYIQQPKTFLGHTNQFKHVKIKLDKPMRKYKKFIGQFIQVKITHATPWALEGKIEKL
jgi:tRNA-2-methylthio-N6-dimethylallyladenosine synthase